MSGLLMSEKFAGNIADDTKDVPIYPVVSVQAGDVETTEPLGLQRRLKARHVQMIAIGSNIGTGLFVGSGKGLHTGGPLALVMGFVVISISLVIMMHCLGEMATILPTSGSFTRYASRFWDRSLGFAMGYNYFLAWVAVFGAESSAFVVLINYWNDEAKYTPLWISIFIVLNLAIHCALVKIFGEVEVVVSILKVITVVGFIIVTWCIMGGAGPSGRVHHGEKWELPGLHNGLYNGFKGLASVFVTAAFAAGGTEMVGVVSGEAQYPHYNLPRAIRTLMWRIVIFYIVSMLFLTFVVQYDDDNLLGMICICVVSVGSTSIYVASRVMRSLAEDGFAPKILARTDRLGKPYPALFFTACVGIILAYLNCSSTGAIVFGWFSSISGLAFFIAWITIISCNWRFHAALKAQGDDTLERRFQFRALLWPWLSIVGMALIVFMLICQFIVSVSPIGASPSASNFFANFLGGPVFLIMWVGHKLIRRPKMKALKEIDLQTDRLEEDHEEIALFEKYESLTKWQRFLTYLRF